MRTTNIVSAILFTFLALPLIAQSGLKITKVNFGFASEYERLSGLNADYLSSLSRVDISNVYNFDQFDDHNLESMSCENPNLKIGLTFETALLPKFEIQTAISYIKDRFDMTYYREGYDYDMNYAYLSNQVNEVGLDLALNRVFSVAKFLKFYAGAGTSIGYAYNGRLNVYSDENTVADQDLASNLGERISNRTADGPDLEYVDPFGSQYNYRTKNALHTRAFLQIGFGFVIRQRFEIGFQARGGVGARLQQNVPLKGSTLESSQFNFSWRLKK